MRFLGLRMVVGVALVLVIYRRQVADSGVEPIGVVSCMQGLGYTLKTIHLSDRRDHSRRVGSLASPCLQRLLVTTFLQRATQQERFRSSLEQTRSELTQHAEVESRISQLQSKQILPIEPTRTGSAACRSERLSANWRTQLGRVARAHTQAGRRPGRDQQSPRH